MENNNWRKKSENNDGIKDIDNNDNKNCYNRMKKFL